MTHSWSNATVKKRHLRLARAVVVIPRARAESRANIKRKGEERKRERISKSPGPTVATNSS